MTFERLRAADWVAMLAALVLLFVMALDWYSTAEGRNARQIQHQLSSQPKQDETADDLRDARQQAKEIAEGNEKNAWQANAAIDRVILLALLGTAALAVGAAFLRAAGRRFEPPWTPSGLAAIAAMGSAALVAYRIVQEPGIDQFSTVQSGALLAVVVLGVIGFASATAMRAEVAGNAFREATRDRPAPPADEPGRMA
jgi:drug/metabolite transporter (DMT)-like permease